MQTIASRKVVTIDYQLSENNSAEMLEEGTLDYLHGFNNLLPALERFLDGKAEGFSGSIKIAAKDAFGDADPALVFRIPKDSIEGVDRIRPGMLIELESAEQILPAMVKSIGDDHVVADANHPYAGKDLLFTVTVKAIRNATAEELAHGHAHGKHGHHH
ncbi:MAG: peptidylprolyl isomerase [Leptospiraceae bacterium]|nr:peptidylprolyl isomerase [Leptospiraceae bacterium]